jgi:hypothetical protein
VERTVALAAGSSDLEVTVRLTLLDDGGPLRVRYGLEWNLLAGAPTADGAGFAAEGSPGGRLDVSGVAPEVRRGVITARYPDFATAWEFAEPAEVWWYPVETVASSERGAELTCQGTCFLTSWDLTLEGDSTRELGLSWGLPG